MRKRRRVSKLRRRGRSSAVRRRLRLREGSSLDPSDYPSRGRSKPWLALSRVPGVTSITKREHGVREQARGAARCQKRRVEPGGVSLSPQGQPAIAFPAVEPGRAGALPSRRSRRGPHGVRRSAASWVRASRREDPRVETARVPRRELVFAGHFATPRRVPPSVQESLPRGSRGRAPRAGRGQGPARKSAGRQLRVDPRPLTSSCSGERPRSRTTARIRATGRDEDGLAPAHSGLDLLNRSMSRAR